jgi:hypothetical protein
MAGTMAMHPWVWADTELHTLRAAEFRAELGSSYVHFAFEKYTRSIAAVWISTGAVAPARCCRRCRLACS